MLGLAPAYDRGKGAKAASRRRPPAVATGAQRRAPSETGAGELCEGEVRDVHATHKSKGSLLVVFWRVEQPVRELARVLGEQRRAPAQ